jgi:hypothetical protein
MLKSFEFSLMNLAALIFADAMAAFARIEVSPTIAD